MSLVTRIEPSQAQELIDALEQKISDYREMVSKAVDPWALKNVPDALYVGWFESMLRMSTVTPWRDPQGNPLPPTPDWLLMLANVRGGPEEIARYTRLKQAQQQPQPGQPFDPMAAPPPPPTMPPPSQGGSTFSNLTSSIGRATGQPAGLMTALNAQGVA